MTIPADSGSTPPSAESEAGGTFTLPPLSTLESAEKKEETSRSPAVPSVTSRLRRPRSAPRYSTTHSDPSPSLPARPDSWMYAGRLPGTLEWTTNLTFGLSTPIPKAIVATTRRARRS